MYFERYKDPKESLELGVFRVHHFENDFQAKDFIMSVLPTILGQNSDLSLGEKLEEYVMKYIRVNNGSNFPINQHVADPSLMCLLRMTIDKRI